MCSRNLRRRGGEKKGTGEFRVLSGGKERLNPVHGQSVRDSPQGMVLGRNANSLSSGLTSRVCVSLLFLGYIDCTEDRTHMWRSYNLQSQLSPSTAWPPKVEVRSPGLMAGTITHHLTSTVLLL